MWRKGYYLKINNSNAFHFQQLINQCRKGKIKKVGRQIIDFTNVNKIKHITFLKMTYPNEGTKANIWATTSLIS